MSLETILEKINEEKKVAEQDLNLVNPRALPYKKGQVNSAKARLETLYIDYKNEVLKQSIFILVTGDQSQNFASIAEESFKCFKLEGKTFYREILNVLDAHLYKDKKINSNIFEIVGNILEDRMKALDIISYNTLMFESKYARVVHNDAEMLDVLVESINGIIGGEVIGLDALERISQDAVNKNYKSRIVPILLYSEDEQFVTNISDSLRTINPRVVRVTAGKVESDVNPLIALEEINEDSVGKALKKIANNA